MLSPVTFVVLSESSGEGHKVYLIILDIQHLMMWRQDIFVSGTKRQIEPRILSLGQGQGRGVT